MNLEQLLNLLPSEIGGYRLTIIRYHDTFKGADMWEVSYIRGEGLCKYCTNDISLEEAALEAFRYILKYPELDLPKGGEK